MRAIFGHILPSPVERKLLANVGKEFAGLREDQKVRAYSLMKSWGVNESWYGIFADRAMRKAIKNVRRNHP